MSGVSAEQQVRSRAAPVRHATPGAADAVIGMLTYGKELEQALSGVSEALRPVLG